MRKYLFLYHYCLTNTYNCSVKLRHFIFSAKLDGSVFEELNFLFNNKLILKGKYSEGIIKAHRSAEMTFVN